MGYTLHLINVLSASHWGILWLPLNNEYYYDLIMLADVANLWLAVVMGCLFRSNITQTVPQGVKGRLRPQKNRIYRTAILNVCPNTCFQVTSEEFYLA